MGKRIRVTKKEAIEDIINEAGGFDSYFDALKQGVDFNELLGENRVYKCECCGSWDTTACCDGNGEGYICETCYDESDHKIAVAARKYYENN